MFLTTVRLGKAFGALGVNIRGILSYKLSPHEQNAFANWQAGALNMIPRAMARIETWLPSFVIAYFVYTWVNKAHALSKRKNPADYLHEVDNTVPDPENPAPERKCHRASEAELEALKCKKEDGEKADVGCKK